ncbi:hypothetical protein FS837_003165 [Tulasnella sp. UAMH 9824]|nr:hypothetical protein FS837_003165 [Tulasnella sp. UAMH 9824]
MLETVVKKGKQPQPQSSDHLVLHPSDKLAEALRWDKVGRPIGLGVVLEELAANKTIIALPTAVRRWRPLWWALSQLPFFGDDGSSLTSEQRWANYNGDYVVLSILKQAADAIIARQQSKPPGFTESFYTRQSFQTEFESVALKGATLSQLDLDVVLKYLERDAREVIVQKNAVKFVEPEDADAIAEGITEVDFGVLEMKTTLQKLADQISEIESQIQEYVATFSVTLPYLSSRTVVAAGGLTRFESIYDGAAKASRFVIEEAARGVASAATEVEIMKLYDTSARTLRAVLQNTLLQRESIEATMERMADALANCKNLKIEDAISLGDDLAVGSARVPDVDDDELEDESEMFIEGQKKEEEEEKERGRRPRRRGRRRRTRRH